MRYSITLKIVCILLTAVSIDSRADLGKETGLRVPRFVSMNSAKVNVRAGPGTRYPIKWVFQRKSLPVQIVAESDTWRKIRDFEGIEGWVHQRMLSGRRRAIVIGAIQQLRRAPERTAKTIALFERGVILRLDKCSEAWCLVESGSYEGWIHRKSIWGVDSND